MNKFNNKAISSLKAIISSRRDIRGNRFLNKKIDDKILNELLEAANNAPSVGFSQPWKFIIVKDNKKREKVYKNFLKENKKAKKIFKTNEIYPNLKLEGIKESYLNIAVLYKKPKKDVLGQTTQKKVGEYSVVCAIQNFWLMARVYGIGVGWVSILKAKKIKKILGINDDYKLIAYLTVGYVKEFLDEPELKKIGWEKKRTLNDITKL
ncbi:5,6-dimethylbenzimidazole synthase [Halarcobacter mediterraneus]|uniref:5,6-dimethylbenzimidazole synthase n=1 Tax=Halarcobacter mediterraneus TaxID=2023153 RepID=A0A4Q1B7T9_9BACT|nr:5,6-dimethylbenzimidazole synthase [Halarcobacter mediterraneus]RXK14669.1 5,6-dimethylbenzimidazole synthase [Halarcobacter mediterraneus]